MSILPPIRVARREALALFALAAVTVGIVAASRFVLPGGLGPSLGIPALDGHLDRQAAGFLDVPVGGGYRLALSAAGRARLVVDGQVVAETPAGGGRSALTQDVAAGARRILIQHAGTSDPGTPVVWWSRSGDAPEPVPIASLSPRRLTEDAWRLRRWLQPLGLALALVWVAAGAWAAGRRAIAWLRPSLPDTPGERRAVWAVLALSLVLTTWAVWWGLPVAWAQDEIGPVDVLGGLEQRFSNGWHSKYPPLQVYVLTLVNAPVLVAARLGLVDLASAPVFAAMLLLGRLPTVAMHAATTALAYLCARQTLPHRPAAFGALAWVLVLPAVYYGKLANLDVPYTCWFAASLLAYLQALQHDRARDYVSFAACAALAVCTKDQAYGLYLLPAAHLAVARARRHGGPFVGLVRLVGDRAIVLAVLSAGLIFALVQNLAFNWSGFVAHVGLITGGVSRSFRMVDSTSVSGQAWLLGRALQQIAWSMSWPGALLAAAGLALAARETPQVRSRLWPMLLPVVSYYLTLIAVIGFHYDRFWIPVCLVFSIFAGLALHRCWPAGRRGWRAAAVLAVIAYMALRTSSIDMLMAADSRYATRRWMREHLPPGSSVARLEMWEMLPWTAGFSVYPVAAPSWDPRETRPDAIVVSDDFPRRYAEGAPEAAWFESLVSGRLGYRVAFRHRSHVPLAILAREPQFRRRDGSFTILHKTNLEMFVLVPERQGAGGASDDAGDPGRPNHLEAVQHVQVAEQPQRPEPPASRQQQVERDAQRQDDARDRPRVAAPHGRPDAQEEHGVGRADAPPRPSPVGTRHDDEHLRQQAHEREDAEPRRRVPS